MIQSFSICNPKSAFRNRQQHTSICPLCSIVENAIDKLALICGEFRRKMIERKPIGALNLNVLPRCAPTRSTAKNNLNLCGSLERAHESNLGALKLKTNFFAQLAPESFFRLFALFDEAAGD